MELGTNAKGAHNPHKTPERTQVGCAHLVRWLDLYFGRKEAYIRKKSCKKISAIGVTNLREYKKQFSARSRERETEENREGDPISEGPLPLRRHGGHGPEGEPSSHLGGGQGRRRRSGALSPSLPVASECTGATIRTTIYINNLATINTNFLPLYAAV